MDIPSDMPSRKKIVKAFRTKGKKSKGKHRTMAARELVQSLLVTRVTVDKEESFEQGRRPMDEDEFIAFWRYTRDCHPLLRNLLCGYLQWER